MIKDGMYEELIFFVLEFSSGLVVCHIELIIVLSPCVHHQFSYHVNSQSVPKKWDQKYFSILIKKNQSRKVNISARKKKRAMHKQVFSL